MTTTQKHLEAIAAGSVTKTNVIGLRKALNTYARKTGGWSLSTTAPKVTAKELRRALNELAKRKPLVSGELHDTGVALLTNRRHRRKLESVQPIVENLKAFRLLGFDFIGRQGAYAVPVYQAESTDGKTFTFRNIPWQSGGNGPEILTNWEREQWPY